MEVQVKWPSYIVDPLLMHRPFLADGAEHQMSRTQPQIAGFEEPLAGLRKLCTDDVYSTARIPLEIEIESLGNQENNMHFDEEKDSALIVLVELLGVNTNYAGYSQKRRFKTV